MDLASSSYFAVFGWSIRSQSTRIRPNRFSFCPKKIRMISKAHIFRCSLVS